MPRGQGPGGKEVAGLYVVPLGLGLYEAQLAISR